MKFIITKPSLITDAILPWSKYLLHYNQVKTEQYINDTVAKS